MPNKDPVDFDWASPYVRFRAVREEVVDDNLFLVDQAGESIHMLNPMGQVVWAFLTHPCRAQDAAETLHDAFLQVSRRQIREDVVEVFEFLLEFDLIKAAQ